MLKFGKGHLSDLLLGVFVLAITALLLIPLPTPLLDVLLSLNLCVSLLLLLVGLYTPNALALLAFPSLLLLTTLFRLSLNVASSRLILSDAYAGRVIEAFGGFLIRGEVVVGIIIFLIITIVNFIVIARGASRVSEVAARFALDSLPGKQMAIDADLRAGSISREEAERRREQLRKESQLYGSMDGAMKFVQGDVIAGLFIIVTNIVGGLYMGLSSGMEIGEAIHTYTVLTVGDGLVSQIPALLVSICAGIMVTRVSSGENTTLGADMGAQLFSRPATVIFAGLLLIGMGAVPGLPSIPFLFVGAVFVFVGYLLRRSPRLPAGAPSTEILFAPDIRGLLAGESRHSLADAPLVINLDSALLFRVYSSEADRYESWWRELQADYFSETGLRLPVMRVQSDASLPACTYTAALNDVTIDTGRLLLDSVLVEMNPDNAVTLGLEVLLECSHPISSARVFWAAQDSTLRRVTAAAGIRTLDFMQYTLLRAAAFIQLHPEEVVSLSDVHSQLKDLEKRYPGLIADVVSGNFVSVSRLTEVLQELARQSVSIKDFKQIIESVASYCAVHGVRPGDAEGFDIDDLVAHVRRSRKRQLLAKRLSDRNTLKVCTLSHELESLFDQSEKIDSSLALDPLAFDAMRRGLAQLLEPLLTRGVAPVSILCRAELLAKVSGFLNSAGRSVNLLSFAELDPAIRVESIGVWTPVY